MELCFPEMCLEKSIQITNLVKIRPVGAELFHVDRRTGMAKVTVALRNLANVPKNYKVKCLKENL